MIGDSEVAVPTHLYKVIVADESVSDKTHLGAFIVPNKPISREHELKEYQVSLDEVETRVGVELVPRLKRGDVMDLCEHQGCKLMPFETYQLYFIGKKMENATTLNRLEKAWKEISEKKLKPDEKLRNLYKTKKEQLKNQASEV